MLNWEFRVTIKEEEVSIEKESSVCTSRLTAALTAALCLFQGGEKQTQTFQKAEFQSAMTQEKESATHCSARATEGTVMLC